MYDKYNSNFDLFTYKKELSSKDDIGSIIEKLLSIFFEKGIEDFCIALKVSGILIESASNIKYELLTRLTDEIKKNASKKDILAWEIFKNKIELINKIEDQFFSLRDDFFDKNPLEKELNGEILLIAAERYIGYLSDPLSENVVIENTNNTVEDKMDAYDSFIGIVSNVIKYFINKNINFKSSSRIYKESDIDIVSEHFMFDVQWDFLMDIKEYFSYSNISVREENDEFYIEILDDVFDRSILVSNFREKGYISSLNTVISSELDYFEKSFSTPREKSNYISYIQIQRMLGAENLNNKIWKVSIKHWLNAYMFIKHTAQLKMKKRRDLFKLSELCIVKDKRWWIKKLRQHDETITLFEATKIIETFIFDNKSKDLIDNPLILCGDKLVLIPSITFLLSPEIALVSMFTHHGAQINFKGYAFENRLKQKLSQVNINAEQIASHPKEGKKKSNRESDLIFILDEVLFILECKSIVPPYTVKDHAKTNGKIINEIEKFKINATYFSENIDLVLSKLDKPKDTKIKEVIKIFITSSTLGTAGLFGDVYVIDEAAFNAFINRVPPGIRDNDMNFYFNQKNWAFEGNITADKLKYFLANPPSLKMIEKTLERKWVAFNNIHILRYSKKISNRIILLSNGNQDENLKKEKFLDYLFSKNQ